MDASKDNIEISVILLDHTEIVFKVNKRDRGQVLLKAVFDTLRCKESKYFGLQFPQNVPDAMKWLDPSKSIRKQFKRGYPLILYYKIKYYISDLSRMKDSSTRYQLFLQVRLEILERRLECPLNKAAVLASYVAQSEIGDFQADKHNGRYLKKLLFIPNQTGEFENEVEKLHKTHRGMTPAQAEFLFLQEAKKLSLYGVDLHYGKSANGQDIEVGVTTDGIGLFKKGNLSNKYDWSKIIKISFKRKQFYIQLQKQKQELNDSVMIEFSMDNYRACKCLWKNCVDCHSFHRQDREKLLIQNRKQGILPTKNGKPVFSFLAIGGKNKTKYDRDEKVMLNFRDPHKSTSTKMLNTSVFLKDKDDFFEVKKKESRRLSAPPSVTLAILPNKEDVGICNISQHSILSDHFQVEEFCTQKKDESLLSPEFSPLQEIYCDSPFPQPQEEIQHNNNIVETYVLPNDLALVRIKPDKEGRFGFNIKGGTDQNVPINISKIAPKSPADICKPSLNIGDEILQINGRDVNSLTHDQAVHFIRATREKYSGELVLLVKPIGMYQACEDAEQFEIVTDQTAEPDQIIAEQQCNTVESSMMNLENLLKAEKAMQLFDKLHRKKPGLTINDAKLPCNAPKNRYRDISPYDISRVKLTNWETDYINGNHIFMKINNTNIINHYVACQGPLNNTCGDFWAMVWEQSATLIVMVTTTVERGMTKCHQYWPDLNATKTFNCLKIKSISENITACFAFREFEIIYNSDKKEVCESRKISHIQYIAWPDHGVPDDSSDFLDFILNVKQKRIGMLVPTIVHCSAGIGRTGVLIAMETAMCLMEANQPVCPLQITRQMRDQRAMMIQTSGQFRFVCEAILRVYKDRLAQELDAASVGNKFNFN